jgi:trigger factor
VEHAVEHGARAVLDSTNLQPIVNPSVTDLKPSDAGISFTLTIEIAPQVVLGGYEGLSFRRDPVIVRPEDVDGVIDGLRRRYAAMHPADRPARWGDLAVVDYEGTVEGKPFEGGTASGTMVHIGAGEAMRDLEYALVGRAAGAAFEVQVAYPEDHANRALAGKTAALRVTVKEVKEPKLPDLDDAFARTAGDYRSLEALRAAVRDRLRAERERETRDRLRAAVVDRLVRFVPAAVPPTLVNEEMQFMAVRGAEHLARSGIRSLDQLRLTPQGFRDLYRPAAVRAVREAFVLDAIARKEGIEVTDDDLEREIQAGRPADQRVDAATLGKIRADGRWERLRGRLRQDRTLDRVLDRGNVEEREIRI